ncbi:MAG: DNA polymerase [Candidatus Kaiserbacteria bacterium]|nr:DNA polymerase [Candidatus Kaiserbacteria bacterium]
MVAKKEKVKRLVLLDTHAIVHRAYHAIPDLTSSKGEPTGALYGLTAMLLKTIADMKPDYIVAARDRAEKTHRHEMYEDYKGTRAKTDDALVLQLKRTSEVFSAFGIPTLDVAGFEADDIIGTVAEQAGKQESLQTIILTGDMDMLQLIVDGRVTVYRLLTGISNMKFYDEGAVKERYGFGPEHVADYKGLCGDASDNIKGIKGIGEKTATELIQKFGSIEDIYKTLKKNPKEFEKQGIKPRVVKMLQEGEKDAMFSKQLATIRRDAPILFVQPDHPWRMEDHAQGILALCEKLEFNSLKSRLHSVLGPEASPEAGVQAKAEGAVNKKALEETAVAFWLLQSDRTMPQYDDILRYAKTDSFESARQTIFEELKKTGRLQGVYEKIERPLIPIIRRMNEDGIFLDVPYLKSLEAEYMAELGKIEARIFKSAGHEFNVSSPKQLANVLFDELKITPEKQKKTPGGARTTREDELEKMEGLHPIIADILAYRELSKLLSTYIEKMPGMVAEDGRLHAEFMPSGTTTGRISSKNPNLQNIPIKSDYGRRVRSAFRAASGNVLVALDYSQIELRIAAGLSGDKKLLQVFKDGGDVHTTVASQVFGVSESLVDYEMRRKAKVINFGILYGMGVNALKSNLDKGVTREEAAKFLANYFKSFSGLALWIERTKLDAARNGFTETLFGRRRYFAGFKSPMPNIRSQAERMAVNAPIQGTQADIIKLAMVEADKMIEENKWGDSVRLVLQIHDELVYEIKEKDAQKIARKICEKMESVVPKGELSGVPIVAEISIGENWGTLSKLARS